MVTGSEATQLTPNQTSGRERQRQRLGKAEAAVVVVVVVTSVPSQEVMMSVLTASSSNLKVSSAPLTY